MSPVKNQVRAATLVLARKIAAFTHHTAGGEAQKTPDCLPSSSLRLPLPWQGGRFYPHALGEETPPVLDYSSQAPPCSPFPLAPGLRVTRNVLLPVPIRDEAPGPSWWLPPGGWPVFSEQRRPLLRCAVAAGNSVCPVFCTHKLRTRRLALLSV